MDLEARHFQQVRLPKYTRAVSLTTGILDASAAGKLAARLFPEMTSGDHAEAAESMRREADRLLAERLAILDEYDALDGAKGKFRPFISGGFQSHWPDGVKDRVRALAHRETDLKHAAAAHAAAVKYLRRVRRS